MRRPGPGNCRSREFFIFVDGIGTGIRQIWYRKSLRTGLKKICTVKILGIGPGKNCIVRILVRKKSRNQSRREFGPNTRAMEKELAQSDTPEKRKIQITIRKYHFPEIWYFQMVFLDFS